MEHCCNPETEVENQQSEAFGGKRMHVSSYRAALTHQLFNKEQNILAPTALQQVSLETLSNDAFPSSKPSQEKRNDVFLTGPNGSGYLRQDKMPLAFTLHCLESTGVSEPISVIPVEFIHTSC